MTGGDCLTGLYNSKVKKTKNAKSNVIAFPVNSQVADLAFAA